LIFQRRSYDHFAPFVFNVATPISKRLKTPIEMLYFLKEAFASIKNVFLPLLSLFFIIKFFVCPQIKQRGHFILVTIALFMSASSIQAQKVIKVEQFKSGNAQEVLKELNAYSAFNFDEKRISEYVEDNDGAAEFTIAFSDDLSFDVYLFERNILSDDYVLTISNEDGALQDVDSYQRPKTYYGYLPNNLNSEIALTIADNFIYGFIYDGADSYFIQPEKDWLGDSERYVIYNEKDAKENPNVSCGVTAAHNHKKEDTNPQYDPENESCLKAPYAIANDYSIFAKYGSTTNVMNRNIAVVNNVNVNYRGFFSSDIELQIVQQVIITSSVGNPWTSSTDPYVLLPDFTNWGPTGFSQSYADASLWSNRDFDGATVGLAYVGTVCGAYRYNVLQDYTSNATSIRVLTAHELGHNFGASHDASGAPYIMAPSVGNATSWSSASINSINNLLASVSCLPSCNQPCLQPTGLGESSISQTSATLVWNQMIGSNSYKVQYKAASSSTWITATNGTAATSITISNLNSGTQYQWRVRSNCTGGTSTYAINGFVTSVNCTTPTGLLTTNITTTSAKLNWNAASGAQNYLVQYKRSSSSTWITYSNGGTANSSNLVGLNPSTAYDWRVRSNCAGGQVSQLAQSSFITLTPCGVPAGASASNITTTTAQLNWTSVFGAASYRVEFKKANVSTWTLVTSGINATSISISNLSQNTAYNWRVKANCSNGLSGNYVTRNFSTLAPCNAPTGLSEFPVYATSATIRWNAASGAQSYRIEYKKSNSSSWILSSNAFTSTSKTLVGLSPSTSYDWRVRSNCSGGQTSQYSTNGFVTSAACSPPTSLFASSITSSSAVVNWTQVSGALTYRVEYKKSTSSTWLVSAFGTSGSSKLINGLDPGVTYNYRIRSTCAGNTTSSYAYANFITSAACNAPQILSFSDLEATSVRLNWTAVSNGISYRIEYKLRSSSSWDVLANSYTLTSVLLTNLSPSSLYDWRVRTNCNQGQVSTYKQASFLTPDEVSCFPPFATWENNINATWARMNWSSIPGALAYSVQYRKTSDSNWTNAGTTAGTNIILTGLQPQTSYNWRVKTICSGESSIYKNDTFLTTSLIYCQSFESGLAGFTQATNDDLDWTRYSGATPSSATGPSSAIDGNYYLYVESSAPNHPDKNAKITSPAFTIVSSTSTLDFNFHMYGSGMGYFKMWIKDLTNGGSTLVIARQNDHGNVWYQSTVLLSNYVNSSVQFVFEGVTGNTWRSDIAIDNFCITDAILDGDFSPDLEDREEIVAQDEVEEEEEKSLSAYPNPASEVLFVEWESKSEAEALIQIFSASGKLVYSAQLSNVSDFYKTEIQLTEFVDGLYYLSIREGTTTKTKKFVVR